MYEIDATLTGWINALAGDAFPDWIMVCVSAYGVPLLVLVVAANWWSGPDRLKTRHALVATGLAFLLGLGINQIILLFIDRIRPYDACITHLLIAPSGDPSFPSDHATAAFAIAASLLLHSMPRRGLAFLAAALLISISRVYVGTHYVSDVMGGALTAVLAAFLIKSLYKPRAALDCFITGVL